MRSLASAITLWGLMTGMFWSATLTAGDEADVHIKKIEQRIMSLWGLPPKSDGLKVMLRYNLARNGSVSSVRVEKTSGNQRGVGGQSFAFRRRTLNDPVWTHHLVILVFDDVTVPDEQTGVVE